MTRLLVHVEGETEEAFVNNVLRDYLVGRGYQSVSARLIGNARQRLQRGGIKPWQTVKRDILRHLMEDRACLATTMVDFYGLPQTGEKAWPGRAECAPLPVSEKATSVEAKLVEDIAISLGDSDARRFIPFVVMHEFEGLLFSDCLAFARGVGREALAAKFQAIRDQFGTPEEINDSPITAPSKRVIDLMPEYQKPLYGSLAILEIGLTRISEACPHFRGWLTKLEEIAS